MEHKHFYNKYIEDLNEKEILWLKENSNIDCWTFNARKIQLDVEYQKSKYLIREFPIIKEIEYIYFNDFLNKEHYICGMKIYEKIFVLYKQIGYKFDILVDNDNLLLELINIYKIVAHIQKTAVKDFYSHIGLYLKNANVEYLNTLIKPIDDIDNIWRLRPNYVIRDLDKWEKKINNPDNSAHRSKQLISYGMVLCEYKKYKEARKILREALSYYDYEIDGLNGYQKKPAIIYYNLYINYLLNDKENFIKIYDKYFLKFKKDSNYEITLLFKLMSINYMLFSFNMISKDDVIVYNKEIYKKYFRTANIKIKKAMILNNFKLMSYRHEHIGEVLCYLNIFYNFLNNEDSIYFF